MSALLFEIKGVRGMGAEVQEVDPDWGRPPPPHSLEK